MRLKEFKNNLVMDLEQFDRYWVLKHKELGKVFPLEMGLGDWLTNFELWAQSHSDFFKESQEK
jgi:hypothetical protein